MGKSSMADCNGDNRNSDRWDWNPTPLFPTEYHCGVELPQYINHTFTTTI